MKCLPFALSRFTKERRVVGLKNGRSVAEGLAYASLLNKSSGFSYGNEKMSELPNVPGQSVCGAGRANGMPVRSDVRQASIAGQSAALRASFHTAAP